MPRVYAETRDAADADGEQIYCYDNWVRREPDFDKADFEAYCTTMDLVLKPGQERIYTPSFVLRCCGSNRSNDC